MPTKPKKHNPLPPFLQAKVAKAREADNERRRKEYEAGQQRTADKAFYSCKRWRDFRKWFFSQAENVLCVECKRQGKTVAATQLDHIKPRKLHPELAFAVENLQGLCGKCHTAKTARGE